MKSIIFIEGYILTDKQGEWWQSLKTDGSTRMWSGTKLLRDKKFKSLEQAKRYGDKNLGRYRVVLDEPPVPPSRTWNRTVLFDSGAACAKNHTGQG